MLQENSNVFYIPLDLINENPYQVRKDIPHDHIGNLASSIRSRGLLEMPAGRAVDNGGNPIPYQEGCEIQLAYGHCRHQAFYLLDGMYSSEGYDKLPVKIVEFTDEEMALSAWTENEDRKQLNPVDRAMTFQKWTEKFGWTQQQIAEKVRLERSTVANLLRLLSLPAEVLGLVAEGTISQRQATALIPYYELPQSESEAILDQDGFPMFLFAAKKGVVSSDEIRERITAAIAVIHPAPPQFNFTAPVELPVPPEPEAPEEQQAWLQKDINGNDVPPEPVPPVEEPVLTAAPAPVIPVNQPALPKTAAEIYRQEAREQDNTSNSSSSATAPAPAAEPAASATPKTWAESQYTVTMGFQAEDGNEQGRQVFVSVRRNEEPPKFVVTREGAWNWNIPWQLSKLIEDLHPEDFQVEA